MVRPVGDAAVKLCGLCLIHPEHPGRRCPGVYTIKGGHSDAVIDRVPCACGYEFTQRPGS
jgi:hypothetical protein